NGMRDVLERTVAPRRRRRRAVTTATGSIAAVTTSMSLSGGDIDALEDSAPIPVIGETIVHPDDESTAQLPSAPVLSVSDLRVGYAQTDGADIEVVHGVSLQIRKGEVHGLI